MEENEELWVDEPSETELFKGMVAINDTNRYGCFDKLFFSWVTPLVKVTCSFSRSVVFYQLQAKH
jgi:hypothetical protein